MRFIICLALCFLLQVPAALAAECDQAPAPGSAAEKSRNDKLIDRALFIGKVRIDDMAGRTEAARDPEQGYREISAITVSPVQTYKGALPGPVTFETERATGAVAPAKKGQIVEIIIFRVEDGTYTTAERCESLSDAGWEALRMQAPESATITGLQTLCEFHGGYLRIDAETPLHCLFPATDEETSCTVSAQCEGVCLADISHLTDAGKTALLATENWQPAERFNITTGHCSPWRNQKGHFVEFGDSRARAVYMEY